MSSLIRLRWRLVVSVWLLSAISLTMNQAQAMGPDQGATVQLSGATITTPVDTDAAVNPAQQTGTATTQIANPTTAAKPGMRSAITLAQALTLVLQSHPSLTSSKERVNTARFQLDGAEYQRFPSLTVDAGKIGGSSRGSGNQSTISLTQPVWTFGRISNTIDAANQRLDAAQLSVAETSIQLQDQLVNAYFETLRTRDRLDAAQDNIATHQRLADTMARRSENGVGSESDLVLARARLSQATTEGNQARSAHRKALSVLSNLLGTSVSEVMNPPILSPRFRQESDLLNQALAFSPTLKRLDTEASALRFEARSAQGSLFPQLVVRAERVESNVPTPFADSRVIAAVQYTPGAGLSGLANSRAADSRASAAASDTDRQRLDLRDRVTQIFNDMMLATEQLPSLQRLKRANAELFESLLRQFNAGKRSWLDVLNAQREYAQSELVYIDAFYNSQSLIRRADLLAGYPLGASSDNKPQPSNRASP